MSYTVTQAQSGRSSIFSIGPLAGTASAAFTQVQEVRSDPWEQRWDTEDVSNFNSNFDKEFLALLRNNGRIPIHANRVSIDAGQQALIAAWESGGNYYFRLQLPPRANGVADAFTFTALVESLEVELAADKCITYTGALQVTGALGDTSVARGSASGYVRRYSSSPLETYEYTAVMWGSFSVQSLPADAVVTGIYPVMVASATSDRAISYYAYGTGFDLTRNGVSYQFTQPFNPNSQTFSATTFYHASLGTSLSVLDGIEMEILMDATLNQSGMADEATITGVGFAVVYTSATPTVDPQLPEPFGIPAGSGLAWATPLTEADTGTTSNGYATGTSALVTP